MKNILIFVFFFFYVHCFSVSIWQRSIKNYDYSNFGSNSQNWMIAQSEKGWIYVANSLGLLEFDGTQWNRYPMNKNIIRAVKCIGNRIYVGGSSEFGYYEPNDKGLLTYKSLNSISNTWGGEVWNILSINGRIHFICDKDIHIYDPYNESLKSISSDYKITASCLHQNKIVIGTSNGIATVGSTSILYNDSSPILKKHKIVSLISYKKDELLIVTARGGLYKQSTLQTTSFETGLETLIKDIQLFSGTTVGSKLLLGSVQNGAYLIDLEQKDQVEHYNIYSGIINNTILNIFVDNEENVWLGMDKGVSFINLNSNIRPLFTTISPIGTGYCSNYYNEKLYLGTNQGIYTIDDKGKNHLIENSEGQIWSMSIIDNLLFCMGDNRITVIDKNGKYNIDVQGSWEIHALKGNDKQLLVSNYNGLSVLKKEQNRWLLSHKIDKIHESIRGLIEDQAYTFWYIKHDSIISKVTLDMTLTNVLAEKTYKLEDQLIYNNKYFREIDNKILIAGEHGIYTYDRLADKFIRYTQLEKILDGQKEYNLLFTDEIGDIWFSSGATIKLLSHHNGSYNKGAAPKTFANLLPQNISGDNSQSIYRLDSLSSIIATENGFSKVDFNEKTRHETNFGTQIRKLISTKQDTIISYGHSKYPIKIPFDNNSIRIEYSTTSFAEHENIRYITRLREKDEMWGPPSSSTSKEYTHLFEGNYIFEVSAINILTGKQSNIDQLYFTILPPWYRTSFAYSIYLLLFFSLIYLLYILTIQKNKQIISRQQHENIIKDQEIYELQHKNLMDSLQYKTQELSGSILNIIRKNEILDEVKKRAIGVSKAIDEDKDRPILKQKILSLIAQIDSNFEKDRDFDVFQSNFDIVHQDFFKQLEGKFPNLSRNDKILCAYLKMNLSSKEISPLLNISTRGVEVGRYRLRKKLGLDREINLSEYLQSLSS